MNSLNYKSLQSTLAADESELLDLTIRLTNVLRLRDNSPERSSEVASLTERIEQLTSIIKTTKDSLRVVSSSSGSNIVVDVNTAAKQLREAGFPRFSPSSQDVLEYLDSFELACNALSVPLTEFAGLFKLLVPFDDTNTLQWVSENIQNYHWEEWKRAVVEHYQDSSAQRLRETKFLNICRQADESLACFCDRFLKLMRLSNLHKNIELCKTIFLNSLPNSLSSTCSNQAHTCSSVEELTKLSMKIQNTWDSKSNLANFIQKDSIHTSTCEIKSPIHVPTTVPKPLMNIPSVAGPLTKKKLFCFYCKSREHAIDGCPKRKQKVSTPGSSKAPTAVCAISPVDANPPAVQKSALTAICSVEQAADYPSPGKLTSVSVSINGEEITGHLDSCSQVSILSSSFAEKLQLPLIPCSLELSPFSPGKVTNNKLTKHPVSVRIGSAEIQQQFLVCDLQSPFICLLGTDVFEKFNLFIGGLQLHATSSEDIQVLENTSPLQYNVSSNAADVEKIATSIHSVLQNNLTATSGFCNLPNALVYLKTIDNDPVWISQYPVSHSLVSVVDSQVDKWLQMGVIEPSPQGCCWNSSLIVVKKALPDGSTKHRVCIDPRHINVKLADDRFPIPRMRDLLDMISGSVIFSALDLESSYHQFQIAKEDRQKTSFSWKGIQYMFAGCPFGLKTMTSIFQRVMSELFSDLPFALVYVDDIIVFSSSIDEHIHHLKVVISRLSQANLTLNSKKCLFGYKQLHVLGHVISSEGIHVDFSKLPEIQNCPRPTSPKDVQSFLGLMNYFRDFVPNFAMVSAPLDALRNIPLKEFHWSSHHENAFLILKSCLSNAPILTAPDYGKPFFIATDASSYGISAVLFQLSHDGDNFQQLNMASPDNKKFIKFCSRSLHKSEKNYPACKRELLAIIFGLQKFENFILGERIILFTDNKPLSYIFSQKYLNSLQYSWLKTLLTFDLDICYCPGKVNLLPDLLSRLSPDALKGEVTQTAPSCSCHAISTDADLSSFPTKSEQIALRMGLDLVTEDEQLSILRDQHSLSHCNARELYARVIRAKKFWLNLRTACEEFVLSCPECQKNTIVKRGYHPQVSILANLPMDHFLIDLMGPLPESNNYKYLLVGVDVFSRFIFLKPLVDKTAQAVAVALYSIFCLFGHPKILQSDNGGEFVNEILTALTNLYGWDHRRISPYYPQANGLVERAVGISIDFIRKNIDESINWVLEIEKIQLKINQRTSSVHNSIPFDVMFSRPLNEFRVFSDVETVEASSDLVSSRLRSITEIVYPSLAYKEERAAALRNSHWNKRHTLIEFPSGTCVMAKNMTPNSKFDSRYLGPFRVVSRTRGGSYKLSIDTGELLSRNFPPSHLKISASKEPVKSFLVEDIVDHRVVHGTPLFRVRWFGFSDTEDTWEPASSFDDPEVIRRYLSVSSITSPSTGNDVNANHQSVD